MPIVLHSFEKGYKTQTIDAPYCRPADWWKASNYKSEEETVCSQQVRRKCRRRTHRMRLYRIDKLGKQWSIMLPSSSVSKKSPSKELEEEFYRLVTQWQKETSFHSSLGEIFTNEAYQRIMAMGRDALPLILSALREKPGHWFYALEKIAGSDVAAGAKTFAEARAAWLEWGYKNNYI